MGGPSVSLAESQSKAGHPWTLRKIEDILWWSEVAVIADTILLTGPSAGLFIVSRRAIRVVMRPETGISLQNTFRIHKRNAA
jgi:hypothetical protein